LTRADGDNHRYTVTDRDSYSGVIAEYNDHADADKKRVVAGTADAPKRLRPTYATRADALAAARAEYHRIRRGAAEFELTLAEGRADLYPETPINVAGFKPDI